MKEICTRNQKDDDTGWLMKRTGDIELGSNDEKYCRDEDVSRQPVDGRSKEDGHGRVIEETKPLNS